MSDGVLLGAVSRLPLAVALDREGLALLDGGDTSSASAQWL